MVKSDTIFEKELKILRKKRRQGLEMAQVIVPSPFLDIRS